MVEESTFSLVSQTGCVISIIGTGNMASALAGRALAGGNAVEIAARDPTKAEELAAALSAFVESLGMRPLDTGQLSIARDLENATLPHHQPSAPPTIKRRATCAFSSPAEPATPVRTSSPS
jgi:predicted dinucleotide-binding enzyme